MLHSGRVTSFESLDRRVAHWRTEVARLAALANDLSSDFEKTAFIRRYTGGLLDIGLLDERTERRYRSLNFETFDPAEFYPLFKDHLIAADCGVSTFFYIKLLQALGFEAFQYSFGFKVKPYARFIHSVALVEIDVGGATRLVVQDPHLNLTYRNQEGEPFDFFELLSTIKKREYDRILMDGESVTTFLLVPEPALYYRALSEPCRALMARALTRPDGSLRTKIEITRDYATLMLSACGGFERGFVDALHQSGYPEPFIYSYALRAADVVGSADHARVQRRIDEVLR